MFSHTKKIIKQIFPDKSIREILFREATPTAIFKIFFVVFTFVSSIVFVRIMGSVNFGIFSHVTAIIDVLKIPVVFGLPILVMRETAKNILQQNWGPIKGVWRWASKFIIFASILIIGLCLLVVALLGNRIDPEYQKALLFGIIIIPFLAFSSLRAGQLRGVGKIVLSQLPEQILFPIIQITLMVMLGITLRAEVSASAATMIFVFSGIIVFIVGYWFLSRNTPLELKLATTVYETKKWFISTVNLAGINGLDIINRQVSLIIVGLLINNPAEIGYYKIAINFSFFASVGLQIASAVFEPRFAKLFIKNDKVELQKLATLSARAILLFNLAITIVLVVFGKPVLSIAYGAEFIASYPPLLILLVGQFINSATGTVANMLNMAGKENLTIKAVASGTVINLVLNIILAPIFGIIGAAIGTVISLVYVNILLWFIVKRQLGINSLPINVNPKQLEDKS